MGKIKSIAGIIFIIIGLYLILFMVQVSLDNSGTSGILEMEYTNYTFIGNDCKIEVIEEIYNTKLFNWNNTIKKKNVYYRQDGKFYFYPSMKTLNSLYTSNRKHYIEILYRKIKVKEMLDMEYSNEKN